MSIFIPSEKRIKSDVQKTWKSIFIGYTGTSKHLKVWAFYIHQVFKPVVNESKRSANLLVEYFLLLPEKSLQPQIGESKPRGWPQKNALEKRPAAKQLLIKGSKLGKKAYTEDVTSNNNVEEQAV